MKENAEQSKTINLFDVNGKLLLVKFAEGNTQLDVNNSNGNTNTIIAAVESFASAISAIEIPAGSQQGEKANGYIYQKKSW